MSRGLEMPSVAFGDSMLPFFQPGDTLCHKPVKPESIQVGDVITFQNNSRGAVTHRVIWVFRRDGEWLFLTKGDNRLRLDTPVSSDRVIGKVVTVGTRDLTTARWRLLGRAMAFFSSIQGKLYSRLAGRPWGPLRRFRGVFQSASNPLGWLALRGGVSRRLESRKLARSMRRRGIRICTWKPEHVSGLADIWNEVYPRHRTTTERLTQRIFQSPWFDPSGCFVAARGINSLGWVWVSLRRKAGQESLPVRRGLGYFEMAAANSEGNHLGVKKILLEKALEWFRRHGVSRVVTGPLPMEEAVQLAPYGFSCSAVLSELRVTPSTYRVPKRPRRLGPLDVQFWQPKDGVSLSDFFRRNKMPELENKGDPKGILLAHRDGRLVGFCRIALDHQIRDISQCRWVWSAADPSPRSSRGYIFQLVVDRIYRGLGVGPWLTAEGLRELFRQGANEIRIWVTRPLFYQKRLGFQTCGKFMVMERRF